ncbi:carbohydrate sulfotransferase 5-like [Rhipicephalus sanguineus]|uniref:carbohydrate sulfotransferase 5-like n=1 Tax=Rhipicephalus sanguineus TaxID=34632 RepID=UPI0018955BBE|nr:carbohydrate sulfotransferase 5-like [Rhipicephalus sanguineus]
MTSVGIRVKVTPPASRPQGAAKAAPKLSPPNGTAALSKSSKTRTTGAIATGTNAYLTKFFATEVKVANTAPKHATLKRGTNDSSDGNFKYSIKAVLLKQFADTDPQEKPPNVRRILVVAYFRSGSSFLGHLLSANPRTFYHFEPLWMLSSASRLRGEAALRGLDFVTDLFGCDFVSHSDYLRLAVNHTHPFMHNTHLWDVCKGVKRVCLDPEFLNAVCKMAPTQVMKVTRIDMDTVRRYLLDGPPATAENLSVVHLVRDPRAIWLSRQHRNFCILVPDCSSAAVLCDEIERDMEAFDRVRYEDLVLDTLNVTSKMYHALEMPFTESVTQFIESHTHENNVTVQRDPIATSRNSIDVVYAWKRKIKPEEALRINKECRRVIKRLGYEL